MQELDRRTVGQPDDIRNIGAIIRNVNALGAEKACMIRSPVRFAVPKGSSWPRAPRRESGTVPRVTLFGFG